MTTIEIKHLRIDPPPQAKAKYNNYLGNEPLRVEARVNNDVKHGMRLLEDGPIPVNLSKWREYPKLIKMAMAGLQASGWRIVNSKSEERRFYLLVEPVEPITPPNRQWWMPRRRVRVTRQNKSIVTRGPTRR